MAPRLPHPLLTTLLMAVVTTMVTTLVTTLAGCFDSSGIADGLADGSPADSMVGSESTGDTGSTIDGSAPDSGNDGDGEPFDGGDGAPDGATDTEASDVADAADAPIEAGCGTIADADVYVDASAAAPGVGTVKCPFTRIASATNLPAVAGRIIHVHTGDYAETENIVVKAGVTLKSASATATKITGTGACPFPVATKTCLVAVASGGILDGFTITATAGNSVVTTDSGAAIVRNVVAIAPATTVSAIITNASAEIGPNVQAVDSTFNGLHTTGTGVVVVKAPSNFDRNKAHGILVDAGVTLKFEGGTASNNGADGVNAVAGSTVVLRNVTTLKNAGFGLHFAAGSGGSLDIGRPSDNGGNAFGSATSGKRNFVGGICLEVSSGTTHNMQGNRWSTCPPSAKAVSSCGATASYADIWATASGVIVVYGGCTVEP